MTYTLLVREVHVSHMKIEADSPKQVVEKFNDGDGDQVYLEYSHTLDEDTWTIEDDKGHKWQVEGGTTVKEY